MELRINKTELESLYGLPPLQQRIYVFALRPHMDYASSVVGRRRKISYQSIAEALYIEPHKGYQETGSPSRSQIRRAIAGLSRAGLVDIQSEQKQLILKLPLATRDYSAQNKPVTNPAQQADTKWCAQTPANTSTLKDIHRQPDSGKKAKAGIPPRDNNIYIFLLSAFDKFWQTYPQPIDKERARHEFNSLVPDKALFEKLMQGLQAQIHHRALLVKNKQWAPNWKNPANWIRHRCWEQLGLPPLTPLEKSHETRSRTYTQRKPIDILMEGCREDNGNVYDISDYRCIDGEGGSLV